METKRTHEEEREGMEIHTGVCEAVIEEFGNEYMLNVCMEEPAELIQAISKARRYPESAKARLQLIEEMADVNIILVELMMIYDIDFRDVQALVYEKQLRTVKRLERLRKERARDER